MSRPLLAAALALSTVISNVALAEQAPGVETSPVAAEQAQDPRWSLTVSPWEMIPAITRDGDSSYFLPNLTVEGDLGSGFSLAGIGGVGGAAVGDFHMPVFELGTQGRYYPVGSFRHGMDVGVQAVGVWLGGEHNDVQAMATGLSLGGFVGYKYAARFGLTVDLQAGAQVVGIAGKAKQVSTGQTESTSRTGVEPLLNLKLGWSF